MNLEKAVVTTSCDFKSEPLDLVLQYHKLLPFIEFAVKLLGDESVLRLETFQIDQESNEKEEGNKKKEDKWCE